MQIFKVFLLLLISLLFSCDDSTIKTRSSDRGGGVVDITDTNGDKIISYSRSYALIIGQSDYASGWDDLNSIPSELNEVQAVLEGQGFIVERHSNLNFHQLNNTFRKFIDNYGLDENNRLLFFYSGHGYSRKVNGNSKGYIVPVDAPNPYDIKGFTRKAVEMEQVVTWAKRIESKHALFLFDSCFSGTVLKTRDALVPQQITKAIKFPVRQFITSGSANEKVPASSTFTPAFVDALRDAKADLYKDGYVTGEELGLYLKNVVSQYTRQTPQYGKINYKYARGDFVFKLKNTPSTPPVNVAELDSVKREKAELARIQRQKEAALAELDRLKRQKTRLARIQRKKQAEKAELARIQREKAQLAKKSKVFQDRLRDGSLGPKMVRIPAGSFRMGDIQGGGFSNEKPVHRVSVGEFAMGMYEITFAEYDKFADATGRKKPNDNGWGRGNRPVINVSWHDATAYAKWLSNQTGYTYRLPTEAEWEYAARAGTETARYWGNDPDLACSYANVHDNTSKEKNGFSWAHHNCTDGYAKTAPVGSFKANKFGLYDMLGNLLEWTCSEYTDKYNNKEKQCVINASRFVLRGGSWIGRPGFLRSAYRDRFGSTNRCVSCGFRLVRL
jgi:formylglycine-generating enzyme required for sulfatase activity